jgi:DNA repair exonuclease SbcCD ATPase subunit
LIAQDVQKVIAEVVNIGDDAEKMMAVNYVDLIPVLVKAIQEQQAQIEKQKSEIEQLRVENASATAQASEVDELRAQLKSLQEAVQSIRVLMGTQAVQND